LIGPTDIDTGTEVLDCIGVDALSHLDGPTLLRTDTLEKIGRSSAPPDDRGGGTLLRETEGSADLASLQCTL
jgi:hypothetical protein